MPAGEALAARAGYAPASAELAFVGARARDDTNDFDGARASYQRAFAEALAGRDPARAVLAASHLAGSLQAKAQDSAGAAQWIQLAGAVYRGIEEPPGDLSLQLLLDETRVLQSRGEFDTAAAKAEAAVRLAGELAGGAPSYLLLRALSNLGNNHIYLGQWDAARSAYERLLPEAEALLGPTHPRLGQLLGNAGAIYRAQGDHARIIAISQRALDIALANFGEQHWESMVALHNLGERLDQAGRDDEALPLYRRALAAGTAAVGAEHPQLAAMHAAIGELLLAQGETAAARTSAQAALRLLQAEDADKALRVRALLVLAAPSDAAESGDALASARAELAGVAEPDLRADLERRLRALDVAPDR